MTNRNQLISFAQAFTHKTHLLRFKNRNLYGTLDCILFPKVNPQVQVIDGATDTYPGHRTIHLLQAENKTITLLEEISVTPTAVKSNWRRGRDYRDRQGDWTEELLKSTG